MCIQKTQSIKYLVSGGLILTPLENKENHDEIGHYIYRKVCKYYGVWDYEKWHKQQPEPIREWKKTPILWIFAIKQIEK